MPKKITVRCYGPIAVSKVYRSPWEDVWLSWSTKPGRRKEKIAPCLCSRSNVLHDLRLYHDIPEDVAEFETILKIVDTGLYHVDGSAVGLPQVYSPSAYIDRAEAERMLSHLLFKQYGFTSVVFKWKRPKFIVIPT